MEDTIKTAHVEAFNSVLLKTKKVAIFTHMNPDGDALGSALTFQMALRNRNIACEIFIANEVPESLAWMPGAKSIKDNATRKDLDSYLKDADLITCLDFNEPGRMDNLSYVLEKPSIPVMVLDHHPQVKEYEGLQIASTSYSSTSELLYWILKRSNNLPRTHEMAECIYTGIATDTGSFAYNSSSPATFKAVAELLEIGFDKDHITELVFQQFAASRMQLLGHMLANRMVIMADFKTAYTYLTLQDLKDFGYKPGDTEGFVNYPLSVEGIQFTAFFVEKQDHVKISFRSKGSFAANAFSKSFFHGGGHLNAAGGKSYKNLNDTLKEFEEKVKAHYHEF